MLMKIRTLLSLLFITATLFAQESKYMQARIKIPFNKEWKFMLGDDLMYSKSTFIDSSWRNLTLPHDWSIEGVMNEKNPSGGDGGFLPCGIGWYRKTFSLPDSIKSKRIFIRFDGVYMNSSVWINDRMVGLRPYGYATFQYDISSFLRFGANEKNVIAVKVDNSLQPSSRWYSGSGIYRNVNLVVTNNELHFTDDGVFVSFPEVSAQKATISVNYKYRTNVFSESRINPYESNAANLKAITKECTLISTLYDKHGNIASVSKDKFTIYDLVTRETKVNFTVNNPHLWTDENPELYQLHSAIECDGKIIDDVITPIGIRSIEFTVDKGMVVNGKSVKIKGVCLHHDAGSFGAAVPIGVWEFRLRKLKTMGCNGIRVSHYPFAPEFYDLCDRLGFYVMEDAFDEWRWGYDLITSEDHYGKRAYSYHMYFGQWAETDLRTMICNDRNHPSIVIYTLGNEMPDQRYEDGVNTLKKLQDIAHNCDPTRPVTVACDFSGVANTVGFLDAADVAGYNYADRYHGEDMYTPDKQKYPNRKFIGTETYNNPRCWVGIKDKQYVAGEFIWSGYDYLGESLKWPLKGWDWGFFDLASFEKPIFYNRKSLWTSEPVVYAAVELKDVKAYEPKQFDWRAFNVVSHWNWSNDGRDSLPLKIFSNCDKVDVLLNNNKVASVLPDKYCVALLKVKYMPGTLKVIGYTKGKKSTEYAIATASEALKLKIVADKQSISATADEVIHLEITAFDKNGNPALVANNIIKVEVSGLGELIGLDNGNMVDHDSYKTNTRKLFEGKARAIIAAKKAGNIVVKVTSSGLVSSEINLLVTQ